VKVPEYVVISPEKITVDLIENEENLEVRRIMIDQYDRPYAGKYLEDSDSVLVDADIDQYGRAVELYRKEIKNDEPIIMIKVHNSSLEPDGTRKIFFIEVPPETTTALGGQAWTCYETEETYNPLIET
jgi:hypothetical protein